MISDEIAHAYAPLVVLHGDEKLLPASPDWFVERSRLRWANGRNRDGEAVPEAEDHVDPRRLGASGEPYRYGSYVASELTRPLDETTERRAGLPPDQGFFLGLGEESYARGDKGTAHDADTYAGSTVCWDYDEHGCALTFWLFYAGSAPPLGLLRPHEQVGVRSREAAGGVAPEEPPPPEIEAAVAAAQLEELQRAYPGLVRQVEPTSDTRGIGDVRERLRLISEGVRALLRPDGVLHEGDWERITVYLDTENPEDAPPEWIAFYRHSTNTVRRWTAVEKTDDTHPVVYSAIGSHASLPSPGFGFIDVGDAHGPRWRTWEELAPVVAQPWYGFGGAWGRVGRVRDSTGPLGPGAHWKHPAPRPTAQT